MHRIIRIINNEVLAFRGLKKPLITRLLNNKSGRFIKAYWWRDASGGIRNFGDEASRDIIRGIFGYELSWRPLWECDLVAIGSVLESAELNCGPNRMLVWGSGYIQEGGYCNKDSFIFCALRGKLSLKRIESMYNITELPLGDPGILINLVYPASKKDGKIGIVPHYVDLNSKVINNLRKRKEFKIISPLQSPKEVAEQISSCSMILSSSLHGMIFADSYDIPNAHLVISKKVIGGSYKFRDYCSGVNRKYLIIKQSSLSNIESIKSLLNQYTPIKEKIKIQRRLIKAFPYKDITTLPD